jgi:SAM-dependent methyltransferase
VSLSADRREWEALGRLDPLWAVATAADKRGGRWDEDEFFATGREEIDAAMGFLERELGLPQQRRRALDFGCGVGRLTRGLAAHFEQVVGVDISAPMVARARALNAAVPNARFEVNTAPDLAAFAGGEHDLVYSTIALQHVSDRDAIRAYVRDFVRLLAPGGLAVFQLPTHVPARVHAHPARVAARALRAVRAPERVIQRALGGRSMTLSALPEDEVRSLVEAAGGRVVHAQPDARTGSAAVPSLTYCASATPAARSALSRS